MCWTPGTPARTTPRARLTGGHASRPRLTCGAKLLVEAVLQMQLRGPGLDGLLRDRGLLPEPSSWAWGARWGRAGQGNTHQLDSHVLVCIQVLSWGRGDRQSIRIVGY